MSLITLVPVGIVVAGIALLFAFAVSLAVEKPPEASREDASAVPVRLWCPTAGELTRAGIGPQPGELRLGIVWCDRFPVGPVTCERACVKAAA